MLYDDYPSLPFYSSIDTNQGTNSKMTYFARLAEIVTGRRRLFFFCKHSTPLYYFLSSSPLHTLSLFFLYPCRMTLPHHLLLHLSISPHPTILNKEKVPSAPLTSPFLIENKGLNTQYNSSASFCIRLLIP